MSIVVLGTVALDTVRTPFGRRRHMLGGSAVHFAMAARLFTDVSLVANVGEDFPDKYIDFLRRKGLVLTSLKKEAGRTFRWQGQYTGDLNTAVTLNTELGVLCAFKPVISKQQKNIRHVFLANVDPDIQRYLLEKMLSPELVGLDSMNYWIGHKRSALLRLLKKIDIFLANEQEARDLSGENNLVRAAKYLRCLGPKMVLIKKGEHGAMLFNAGSVFILPAYPTDKVIDPTGAGDTFAGAFMGCLVKAKKIDQALLRKAVAYGIVAASFNVEGFGVNKTSNLTLKGLDSRLAGFKRYVLF